MRKIILIIQMVLAACFSIQGLASVEDQFTEANAFYKKGEFSNAIKTYKAVEKQNVESAELFYNMGNTYYRLKKVGWSILYYEKALKLDPSLEDAKLNLEKAKKKTVDKIEVLPVPGVVRVYKNFLSIMNTEGWAKISLILGFLFAICMAILNFNKTSVVKKSLFFVNIILVGACLMTLVFALSSSHYDKDEMVLVKDNVYVKSEPTTSGTDLFILHEGAKVQLKKTNNAWIQVKLSDGLVGWVKEGAFKNI